MKQSLLDNVSNDIGKMELAPRKLQVTQAMTNNIKERGKAKTTESKEYKTLNNQQRRENVYIEEECAEITDL